MVAMIATRVFANPRVVDRIKKGNSKSSKGELAEMGDKASLLVNVFDGTRSPIASDVNLLITINDGNQKQIVRRNYTGSRIAFPELPFYNNFGDNYTVLAYADNFEQAGFHPVKVSDVRETNVDIMLLPKDGRFNFRYQDWTSLQQNDPELAKLLGHGAADDAAAGRYNELVDSGRPRLAGLFNITTAMSQIHLPIGTPLDYLKEVIWDDTMKQDRFFSYADKTLISQVRQAAAHGLFKPEHGASLFHHGATLSYKQVQFGEANVQLTFHEGETRTIDGTECVKVEPDIDYYKDPLAHALLEVVPNTISGLTNPKQVYVLRWIAGRHAGVPEFSPPYTIES